MSRNPQDKDDHAAAQSPAGGGAFASDVVWWVQPHKPGRRRVLVGPGTAAVVVGYLDRVIGDGRPGSDGWQARSPLLLRVGKVSATLDAAAAQLVRARRYPTFGRLTHMPNRPPQSAAPSRDDTTGHEQLDEIVQAAGWRWKRKDARPASRR
jgi:hypothetical protein